MDALSELEGQFRRMAARIIPGDLSSQDDLCQIMLIAVWQCDKLQATREYYRRAGNQRALDWRRRERVRNRLDLKMRAVEKLERV